MFTDKSLSRLSIPLAVRCRNTADSDSDQQRYFLLCVSQFGLCIHYTMDFESLNLCAFIKSEVINPRLGERNENVSIRLDQKLCFSLQPVGRVSQKTVFISRNKRQFQCRWRSIFQWDAVRYSAMIPLCRVLPTSWAQGGRKSNIQQRK